ncbi:hypothetical protein CR513_47581, partial [Mucuna pruriens]
MTFREYFFDILGLAAMGLDLTTDLKASNILPFFENEQVVHPKLTNYEIDDHFISGSVLRGEFGVDLAFIATTTWCKKVGKVWEEDYGGDNVVEDALLRPDVEGSMSFGKNNIAPMRLNTIHLTLPSVAEEDVKPTQANLDLTIKVSKKVVSKCRAPSIKTTRVTANKQRKLIL